MAWLLLLVPVATGTLVMWLGDALAARTLGHVVPGLVGLVAYAAVRRVPRLSSGALVVATVAALAALAATLAVDGLDGVHRWLLIGPLRVHPSALLVPSLLVLAAANVQERPRAVGSLLLGVQVIHLLQPDAGQATALAAASAVLLLGVPNGAGLRVCALASIVLAAATWLRPDPLPPAPFVEDIVTRAFAVAPSLGALALLSLGIALLAPRVATRDSARPSTRLAANALLAYFVATFVVPAIGNFPVPLLGFGASPVIGSFLAVGVLRRLAEDDM